MNVKIIGKKYVSIVDGKREIYWFPISWLKNEIQMFHLRQKNWFTTPLELKIKNLIE